MIDSVFDLEQWPLFSKCLDAVSNASCFGPNGSSLRPAVAQNFAR